MDRFYFAVPLLLSACGSQDWKQDLDRLRDVTAALPVVSESAPRAPSNDADLDKQLAGPLWPCSGCTSSFLRKAASWPG